MDAKLNPEFQEGKVTLSAKIDDTRNNDCNILPSFNTFSVQKEKKGD